MRYKYKTNFLNCKLFAKKEAAEAAPLYYEKQTKLRDTQRSYN